MFASIGSPFCGSTIPEGMLGYISGPPPLLETATCTAAEAASGETPAARTGALAAMLVVSSASAVADFL